MQSKLLSRTGNGLVLLAMAMLFLDVVHAGDNDTSTDDAKVSKKKKPNYYEKDYGQDVVGYGDENRDRSYSSNRNEYDNNYDNDDNNDSGDDYRSFGSSSGRRGNNPRVRGRDPRPFGQDMADSKEIYDDKDSMLVSLDVWITSAKDWEQKRKNRYRSRDRGEYQGDKYKKNRNNKDKDYKGKEDSGEDKDDYKRKDYGKKDNYRKKRSYKCVRFPVRHYKEVRRFPIRRFPPLFSTFPWLPIFYDKITYQTFIFSPVGGIYVLPPLINFYGQRFAVAQLIKWGYASLVSTGVPPPPSFDVAPLIQPGGPVGGGVPPPPALGFNANNGQFNGGVPSNFPSFQPRSAQVVREDYETASNIAETDRAEGAAHDI